MTTGVVVASIVFVGFVVASFEAGSTGAFLHCPSPQTWDMSSLSSFLLSFLSLSAWSIISSTRFSIKCSITTQAAPVAQPIKYSGHSPSDPSVLDRLMGPRTSLLGADQRKNLLLDHDS